MHLVRSMFLGVSYFCIIGSGLPQVSSSTKFSKMSQQPACSSSSGGSGGYSAGSHSVAFVTTPDETSAKKIAHALVTNNLAACVNIVPQITSIYHWEGKVNEDAEVLMMIKTRTSRVDELTKFVQENHPYSVAEVISLPIENGNVPYLDWITNTVPEKAK